ncbi:hypothetical protein [Sorangium cellulosum]|uniref:hypothetical protein n=1 Tax=Sorangium cellulosum TaxID=56 RepID=UPI003D9C66FA
MENLAGDDVTGELLVLLDGATEARHVAGDEIERVPERPTGVESHRAARVIVVRQ